MGKGLYADLVFLNGRVVTIDADDNVAEAVAVRGDLILSVGSTEEVSAFIGDDTEVGARALGSLLERVVVGTDSIELVKRPLCGDSEGDVPRAV